VCLAGCTDCRCLLFKHPIQIDRKSYIILWFFGIGINKKTNAIDIKCSYLVDDDPLAFMCQKKEHITRDVSEEVARK